MKKRFAFNVFNYSLIEHIIRWSKEYSTPVIIQTSVSFIRKLDLELFYRHYQTIKDFYEYDQVMLHLDHCKDEELIERCYQVGWDSALFDGSHLNLEENIRQTKKIRKIADRYNKLLEGEITPIYGIEDDEIVSTSKLLTTVEQASRFCKETEIDWFAPSVGTYHGIKKDEIPQVDIPLLNRIYEQTRLPLVLHGGSGLDQDDFRKAFLAGVMKINISTELKLCFFEAMNRCVASGESNPINFDQYFAAECKKVIVPKLELSKEVNQ